jgi:membrane protein
MKPFPSLDFDALKGRFWHAVPRPLRWPLHIAVDAGERWSAASGAQLSASIAFYTMFALAPLLVITIAVAGVVFGPEAARGQIVGEISHLVGPVAAQAIEGMIASAWRNPGGLRAALIGTVTLLIGASGAFLELRRALNAIGRVAPPKASAVGTFLRIRLTAFALLLGCGFLAIASLLLSAALVAFTNFLTARYAALTVLVTVVDLTVSAGLLTAAFAALIRWLPDVPPSRKGIWISAAASAVLFTFGKSLISLYLGRSSVASSYGAAGSFVVLLLWINYSAQILLYGAALGRVSDEYDRTRSRARKRRQARWRKRPAAASLRDLAAMK